MGFSGNSQANDIHTAYSNPYKEKLRDWDWFQSFLELNPDVKERWFQSFLEQNPDVKEQYEVHKTYEILNDTRNR